VLAEAALGPTLLAAVPIGAPQHAALVHGIERSVEQHATTRVDAQLARRPVLDERVAADREPRAAHVRFGAGDEDLAVGHDRIDTDRAPFLGPLGVAPEFLAGSRVDADDAGVVAAGIGQHEHDGLTTLVLARHRRGAGAVLAVVAPSRRAVGPS